MRIQRGAADGLRLFAPAVMLKFSAEVWDWDTPQLERLRAAAESAAGEDWIVRGPSRIRPGHCIVYFSVPNDRCVPSGRELLDRLSANVGLEEVTVTAPAEWAPEEHWQVFSAPGAVSLRVYTEALGISALAAWAEESLAWAVADGEVRSPMAVFGLFRAEPAELANVVQVVSTIGTGATPCSVVWWRDGREGLLVGSVAGGSGFQVALFGLDDRRLTERAHELARLGGRLSEAAPTVYARISIEPTGAGVLDPSGRSQDHPAGVFTRPFGPPDRGSVPDAFWWQLIETAALEGCALENASTAPTDNGLTEVRFGEPEEWMPATPWPGDVGAPDQVPPSRALQAARDALRPLLEFR